MPVFILRQPRITLQCMRFTRLSASIKTAFAFSLLWGHNACVSHACLHLLRQLLRFFCIVLQCMRFTGVSASVKTTFNFFLVWGHCECNPPACLHRLRRLLRFSSYRVTMHACLHLLRRLLRFPWYAVTMQVFHTRVCIWLLR